MAPQGERERGWMGELVSYAAWAACALIVTVFLYWFFFGRMDGSALDEEWQIEKVRY